MRIPNMDYCLIRTERFSLQRDTSVRHKPDADLCSHPRFVQKWILLLLYGYLAKDKITALEMWYWKKSFNIDAAFLNGDEYVDDH